MLTNKKKQQIIVHNTTMLQKRYVSSLKFYNQTGQDVFLATEDKNKFFYLQILILFLILISLETFWCTFTSILECYILLGSERSLILNNLKVKYNLESLHNNLHQVVKCLRQVLNFRIFKKFRSIFLLYLIRQEIGIFYRILGAKISRKLFFFGQCINIYFVICFMFLNKILIS